MVVQGSLPDLVCSPLKSDKKHRLKQRFDVQRKLGQGTYGKVQLAINRETGQEVAVKTIKKVKIENEQDLIRIRREIQIMSSIQHPHLIHIYEVFENKDKIVLVMQFASGGELYDYLSEKKVLSDLEARRIFRQIAAAVYYCHKNKICHRDLKLENILLDEKGNAKIADFGLSNVFDEKNLLNTYCGSPLYASPEIVKGVPYYGAEVDCWSMGVLLYTLVYGAMPFDGSNFKKLVTQISEGDYFEPKKKSNASELIRKLLTVNPSKRATIVDICVDCWVNAGYEHSLLQVAEDMANLTPVRLDLLLALAPGAVDDMEDTLQKHQAAVGSANQEAEGHEAAEEEEEEEEDTIDTAANSFAFTKGSRSSHLSVSSPNLQKSVDEYEEDSEEDFLPADIAAALQGECGKRLAEASFGSSLARISSLAHHSKKPKKSDSSNNRATVEQLDRSGDADRDEKQGTLDGNKSEKSIDGSMGSSASTVVLKTEASKSGFKDAEEKVRPSKAISEVENEKAVVGRKDSQSALKIQDVPLIIQRKESLTTQDEKLDVKKAGRPPGKIIIPKTFDSPQSTPSPKPGVVKKLVRNESKDNAEDSMPKGVSSSPGEISKKEPDFPKSDDINKNVIDCDPKAENIPKNIITEEQKSLAKGILKKGISKAKLSERKLSKQGSMDSEASSPCSPPISASGTPEPKPSFFKTPKPFVKDEAANVTSKAEIKLSSTQSSASTLKNEPTSSKAPLWDSGRRSPDRQLVEKNLNWSAISSTIDSEMSGWREQMEESLRRLSPEDERSSNPSYALSKLDDDKPLVPIARSYKKFTFTKDGACITETKKIYTTPGADGSWTKVEKKTKITTRPGNVEEFEKFRDLHLRNESSNLTRSDSQSSSGSNDVYDDIFDSWTGDKMMCNMRKMNNMFQTFSRDPFLRKERRRNPFRFFRRTESEKVDQDKKAFRLRSGRSTDRESSENEEDYDVHFDDSNAVVYGSQGLWQFLRSANRGLPDRVSSQHEPIAYGHSVSQDPSQSTSWRRCNSKTSSGYNTGTRSQSRDRTQSPRERVLRFVFESPREGFSREPSVQESPLRHWSTMKKSQSRYNPRRDSGVGSDGYESEYSIRPSPSDEMTRAGRVSSVRGGGKQDMIRSFMKSWSKDFMSPPASPTSPENAHEHLENLPESRRNRVEQWLHTSSDRPEDGHPGISSRKPVSSHFSDPPAYATMRPREYFQYGRSSSDKLGECSEFFPSFEDSHRRRSQTLKKDSSGTRFRPSTYSPVSEESLREMHSVQSDSSGSSMHHINFTISDGRVESSRTPPQPASRYVRHFSNSSNQGSVTVKSPSPTSVRFEQTSPTSTSSQQPVLQMRVSINRNQQNQVVEVTSQSPQEPKGLWNQQDSLRTPRPCVINLNRSPSPVPGIRQFSTEVQHSVGSSDKLSQKAAECESPDSCKARNVQTGKNSPHALQLPAESSIWDMACPTKCMDNPSELTNINKIVQPSNQSCACELHEHSYRPKDLPPFQKYECANSDLQSPLISNGENTPDSLEDLSTEQSMTSDSLQTVNTDYRNGSQESLTKQKSSKLRVNVQPLGALWNSCDSQLNTLEARQNGRCVGIANIQTFTPCSVLSDESENVDLQTKSLEKTSSEIGSIWNQKNAYQTFDLLKNLLSDDGLDSFSSSKCVLSSSHPKTNQNNCPNENNFQHKSVFDKHITVIDNIELKRLSQGESFRKMSLVDDLQSPKEVLRQAMKICDTFEQI